MSPKTVSSCVIATLFFVSLLPESHAQSRDWRLQAVPGPSARSRMEMVYDSARGVCVLYGGRGPSSTFSDTWEWNGFSWTERTDLPQTPGPRYWYGMSYDKSRQVVVLFGGQLDNLPSRMNDVWEYDGATWAERIDIIPDPSFGTPPANVGMAFTYDPVRATSVMHGGDRFNDDFFNNEVWEYDGVAWTRRADAPDSRRYHTMAYHSGLSRVVRYGGYPESNRTHHYDGTTWVDQNQGLNRNYYSQTMAYDASFNEVVLFSGHTLNQLTWTNDGTGWTEISGLLTQAPSARFDSAMTFDETRQNVILFGGNTAAGRSNETWTLGLPVEMPEDLCQSLADAIDIEWPLLAADLGLNSNIVETPGQRIPERWGLAMVHQIICKPKHPHHLATVEAYLHNLGELENEPLAIADRVDPYKHILAALLLINQARQDHFKSLLGLTNTYLVVRGPSRAPEVEVFDDDADLDGDGLTNVDEYDLVVAGGGSIEDFAEAVVKGVALTLDLIVVVAAFGALIAFGSLMLRRKRHEIGVID